MANCPRTSQRAGGTVGLRGGRETRNLRRIKRLSGTEFPTSDDCVHFSDSCFIGCKSRCVIAHAPCCAGNRFTMRTRDEQGGYGSAAHRQKVHPWCAIIRRWINMRNDIGITPDKNRLSGATHDGPSMSSELPPCRRGGWRHAAVDHGRAPGTGGTTPWSDSWCRSASQTAILGSARNRCRRKRSVEARRLALSSGDNFGFKKAAVTRS